MKDTAMVHLTRGQLVALCIMRMGAPTTDDPGFYDMVDEFLDRAAAEIGFTDWVGAFRSSMHVMETQDAGASDASQP